MCLFFFSLCFCAFGGMCSYLHVLIYPSWEVIQSAWQPKPLSCCYCYNVGAPTQSRDHKQDILDAGGCETHPHRGLEGLTVREQERGRERGVVGWEGGCRYIPEHPVTGSLIFNLTGCSQSR